MKDFCILLFVLCFLFAATVVQQLQLIQQNEKIIQLQSDNATQWQHIRLNSSCMNDHRVTAVENNLATFEKDNYKTKKLTARQKKALDKRWGLNYGENRPLAR